MDKFENRGLFEELEEHEDEVISVCVEDCRFTGLLCSVRCDFIKMITHRNCCPCRSIFGNVTLIPIHKIDAVTFCETGC